MLYSSLSNKAVTQPLRSVIVQVESTPIFALLKGLVNWPHHQNKMQQIKDSIGFVTVCSAKFLLTLAWWCGKELIPLLARHPTSDTLNKLTLV